MAKPNKPDSPVTVAKQVESGETIRFKCRACRQPMEAEMDMMGSIVDCPNCGQKLSIPLHIFSVNPFRRPLQRLGGTFSSIQWHLPYFPQLIESVVLIVVSAITLALYLSVGIASQIAGNLGVSP